ncbi:MAG: hypothetical protein ABI416_09750, partial [Ginsengibacter sp.]
QVNTTTEFTKLQNPVTKTRRSFQIYPAFKKPDLKRVITHVLTFLRGRGNKSTIKTFLNYQGDPTIKNPSKYYHSGNISFIWQRDIFKQ